MLTRPGDQDEGGAGPGAGAAAAVLDPAALAKLRELDPSGSAGVVPKVLRTYEASMQRLMGQFDAARATGDTATLARVAHTLRSSSASVGALAFSAQCLEVETLARDGRQADLESAVKAMKAQSEQVVAAVRAMLDPLGPAP